jgi:hypothetical protein
VSIVGDPSDQGDRDVIYTHCTWGTRRIAIEGFKSADNQGG